MLDILTLMMLIFFDNAIAHLHFFMQTSNCIVKVDEHLERQDVKHLLEFNFDPRMYSMRYTQW